MYTFRAYGPGEFKVLTSTDGGNVQEAAGWRSAKRKEVSYKETVMFDSARNVKALTVAMRSPMPWGYFGLNDIALVVEPGPMMLISGSSSEAGERCMVSLSNSVGSEDCLQAIAAGAGREIFTWNDESQLASMHEGKCVSLASGTAAGGGVLALQDCAEALEAGDGRSAFELTATGQLRFKHLGNYCIVASQASVHVQDCGAAEESNTAQDRFFLSAVPEFDPSRAAAAADAAALLQAAAARQAALAAELHEALPRLEACRLALSTNKSYVRQPLTLGETRSQLATAGEGGAVVKAIGGVCTSLGVDMAGINRLIIDTAGALASARSKAAVAA